ncbi:hypothetical protein RYX36_036024, partial [Vicia faba]
KMTNNQDRLRHNRVFQHAFVRGERARPSRPPVGASSFDAKTSNFGVQVSSTSSSQRQVSPVTSQ